MERIRVPDALAGLFGLVLMLSLGMPWFSYNDVNTSGSAAFAVIDIVLLLAGASGVVLVVVTWIKDTPALPIAVDVVATWIAGIASLFVLYRLFVLPGPEGVEREFGQLVGTLCTLGVLFSAFLAMRIQDAPGLRANPQPERMPAPPPEHLF
jgi:hypothetical protein